MKLIGSLLLMSSAAADKCDMVEAWSGQRQILVPECKGTGCNANGKDWNCAWCVYDMDLCKQNYGVTCAKTAASREADAENMSCHAEDMKNIVELAQATDDLSTLVTAVVAADLVDTLSSPGPFTVFAPTNEAFGDLPAGTLDSLLKPDNKDQLVDILTYHVVAAAAESKDLSDGQRIETVEGKEVTVSLKDGVKINDATVVTADVMASNGVVHIIDGVLLPPRAEEKNIVELAQATDDLSTLVTAVVAADLVDTLSSPGPFTVFAPTNEAFGALPAGTVDSLLKPENKAKLADILTYHVVAAAAYSTDLSDGQKIGTVEGKEVTVSLKDGVKINDATVVTPDVKASNGVVHIIDGVLLPPADVVV